MIGLFLADSDLNSLFASSWDQLQKVVQPGIALVTFRTSRGKDFARGFSALEFPDSHSVIDSVKEYSIQSEHLGELGWR